MGYILSAKVAQGNDAGRVYAFVAKKTANGEHGIVDSFRTKTHTRPIFTDERAAMAAWHKWLGTLEEGTQHNVTERLEPQIEPLS